jgi:hypothetical protein
MTWAIASHLFTSVKSHFCIPLNGIGFLEIHGKPFVIPVIGDRLLLRAFDGRLLGGIGDRVSGLEGLAFGDFQIAHGGDGDGDR